jgi:hypothetical protein
MKRHIKLNTLFTYALPIWLALSLVFATHAYAQVRAQKIGDNPTVINADAALEVEATDKGFLPPRVALTSTTNPSPLSAHVAGMLVYNTATTTTGTNDVKPGLYENDGSQWAKVGSGSGSGGSAHEFEASSLDNFSFPHASNVPNPVLFTTKEYDVSNAYNLATGEYTAPEDGVYVFSAAIQMSNASTNNAQIHFYVNGEHVSQIIPALGAFTVPRLAHSRVIKLNQGDKVSVGGYQSTGTTQTITAGRTVAFFSGALIGGGSGGTADNLGDHKATQNLDLATYKLVGNGGTEGIAIDASGNVGIGITPSEKLHVDGNILATGTITPDYVFEKYYAGISTLKADYKMSTLAEIEAFTKANMHLPGVPSAKEVEEKGGILINRATEINLEKIEELYLHTIEQQKQLDALKKQVEALLATQQE